MTDIILLANDILKYAFLKHYLKTSYRLPIPKGNKKKIEVFTMKEQEILIHYLLKHFNNFNFGILDVYKRQEEERRLFYVAMTRAKRKLIISYVKEKNGKSLSP